MKLWSLERWDPSIVSLNSLASTLSPLLILFIFTAKGDSIVFEKESVSSSSASTSSQHAETEETFVEKSSERHVTSQDGTTFEAAAQSIVVGTHWHVNSKRLTYPVILLYIQMQLCHQTLRQWLHSRNANDTTGGIHQEIWIFTEILRGIAYIHGNKIIHRDIKVNKIENLLLRCRKQH